MVFKVIVLGLLAWQLVLLLRRRREKPAEPTYVFIPPDTIPQKDVATFLNQKGPPPSYDAKPIKY